jgi:3-oxoacyl-[acyl-carrier-protein] synthase III
MPTINISDIDIGFAKYSYTIKEIVDDLLKDKLDEEVKEFCKKELGISRVYKSYDLSRVKFDGTDYLPPVIRLNDMYVSSAKKILRKPENIGLLITINDCQQYLDPAPTVEVTAKLGLSKEIRTQNFQGLACSSFSEAMLNAAGHFALGKGDALVLIGTYYTGWFLDRIRQIDRITMKNRKDFNNFIYFLIFSDVTAAAILSKSGEKISQVNTDTICSRKDTNPDGYKKATLSLAPDSIYRMVFDMNVNSKLLKERSAELCLENISQIRRRFPKEYARVKSWGLHSAGKIFVDYIIERCSIEKTKAMLTYDLMKETGNTGAASSLQTISESVRRKVLNRGELGGIVDYGWEGADAFLYNT